jgi:hypothetical protein
MNKILILDHRLDISMKRNLNPSKLRDLSKAFDTQHEHFSIYIRFNGNKYR